MAQVGGTTIYDYYSKSRANAPDTGDFDPKKYIDDKNSVDINDFFTLMAAQLSGQDMFNPVDNSQFLAQLAQMTSMESMKELTYSMNSNLAASMVGKNVIAAKFSDSGELETTEGIVERVLFANNEIEYYVGGKKFKLSNIMEVKAAQTKTEAPAGLTAAAGDTKADLSWKTVSGATSYNVKRAEKAGGPYTTLKSGLTTSSYTDKDLTNGTKYYYVVSAVNSVGESVNSAEVNVTPSAST